MRSCLEANIAHAPATSSDAGAVRFPLKRGSGMGAAPPSAVRCEHALNVEPSAVRCEHALNVRRLERVVARHRVSRSLVRHALFFWEYELRGVGKDSAFHATQRELCGFVQLQGL